MALQKSSKLKSTQQQYKSYLLENNFSFQGAAVQKASSYTWSTTSASTLTNAGPTHHQWRQCRRLPTEVELLAVTLDAKTRTDPSAVSVRPVTPMITEDKFAFNRQPDVQRLRAHSDAIRYWTWVISAWIWKEYSEIVLKTTI
jgi:hypothetical protein